MWLSSRTWRTSPTLLPFVPTVSSRPVAIAASPGGRTARYGGFDDDWVAAQDTETRVYPMTEDAGALAEIDAILALDTVDGVFVGPSDLSRERGAYCRTDADFADLRRVADAACRADKPWVLPAWAAAEKEFALLHGADQIVLLAEHAALMAGFGAALSETRAMATIWPPMRNPDRH
jgi:4-hydroxy-2-oxoheptanedioate aldolase